MLARKEWPGQDSLIQRGGIAVIVDLFKLATFNLADPACAVLELDALGRSACRGDEHDCSVLAGNKDLLQSGPSRALYASECVGVGINSKEASEGAQEA